MGLPRSFLCSICRTREMKRIEEDSEASKLYLSTSLGYGVPTIGFVCPTCDSLQLFVIKKAKIEAIDE